MSVCPITDWRVCDEDLPDVPPGEAFERVITPQKHVVLLRMIVVRDFRIVGLRIGAVEEVPFEVDHEGDVFRAYRPNCQKLGDTLSTLVAALVKTGARTISADKIWIPAGMDVRVTLRNEGTAPFRPRVVLLVQEEVS